MTTKKQLDLTKTKNLHKGFKNLNPVYDQMRFKRAQDLANNWLEKIGKDLKEKVRQENRKNFIKFLEEGNKLSYTQIKNLGKTLKGDYTN